MNPRTSTAFLASLLLPLLAPHAAPAAEPTPRKCVAFFVGIEKFTDPSLNTLQFVAEDTFAVWNRLKEITKLDESRSTLLVVDRVNENGGPLPTGPSLKTEVTEADVEAAFRAFRSKIQDDDLIVIYLQGHGLPKTFDPEGGSYFLCSDFTRHEQDFEGGVQISDFKRRIKTKLMSHTKPMDVVFFANMCHAGEAYGAMGGQQPTSKFLDETVRHDMRQVLDPTIAYIAASAANAQTFEVGPRSEFASNLLETFSGAGAEQDSGKITTNGILKYLQATGVRARVPDPEKGFPGGIVVGHVGEREAHMRRFLANSLFAIALDQQGPARAQFLQLADAHFARCMEIHGATKLDNLLSRLQVRRLQEKRQAGKHDSGPDDLMEFLPSALNAYKQSKESTAYKLTAALSTQPKEPLAKRFVAGILEAGGSIVKWQAFLNSRAGHQATHTFPYKLPMETVFAQMAKLCAGQNPQDTDLLLVYSESADLSDLFVPPPSFLKDLWEHCKQWRGNVLVAWDAPHGREMAETLPPGLRQRVHILVTDKKDLDFALGQSAKAISDSTDILLEDLRNGLTQEALMMAQKHIKAAWSPTAGDRAPLETPEPAYLGDSILFDLKPQETSGIDNALAVNHSVPGAWWALDFACKGQPEPAAWRAPEPAEGKAPPKRWSEEAALPEREGDSPFALVRKGALFEAQRNPDEAWKLYERVLKALDVHTPASSTAAGMDTLRSRCQENLVELRTSLRAFKYTAPKAVHAVLAQASNYESPLVGDLRGPPHDVAAWADVLREKFKKEFHEHRPASGSRADIWRCLEKAKAECTDNDVLLFIFSGRGAQLGDQRFLAAEDAEPQLMPGMRGGARWPFAFEQADSVSFRSSLPPRDAKPVDNDAALLAEEWKKLFLIDKLAQPDGFPALLVKSHGTEKAEYFSGPEGLLALPDVAHTLADCRGSVVVLLDCQFMASPEPHPLQKHVDSITPTLHIDPYPSLGDDDRSLPRLRPTRVFSQVDTEALIERELANAPSRSYELVPGKTQQHAKGTYIWCADRLQDPHIPRQAEPVGALSSFSRQLISALQQSVERSYGEWLDDATKTALSADSVTYVLQGSPEEPLFASDRGGAPLRLLLSNHHARLANLNLAIHVCEEATHMLSRPQDHLTLLMLFMARAELLSAAGVPPLDAKADEDATQAEVLLTKLRDREKDLSDPHLLALYLDVGIRTLETVRSANDAINFLIRLGWLYPDKVYSIEWVPAKIGSLTKRALDAEADRFLEEKIKELEALRKSGSPPALDKILKDLKTLHTNRRASSSILNPIK